LVNSAPSTLNTLKELSDALGGDAAFATTVTNSIAAKAPLASPTFTGTITTPLTTAGYVTTNSSGVISSVATIPNSGLTNSSITINGTPVSLGGSTTISAGDSLPTQSGNTGKYLTTDGTAASWGTIDLSSKLNTSDFTYSTISIPVYDAIENLPSASSNHGRWAHVHSEGSMYFAHEGSWIKSAVYPSQSGQSGKYLSTDGTSASWSTISTATYSNGTNSGNANKVFYNNTGTLPTGTAAGDIYIQY
jgi:hypothetical protein